MGEGRRLNELTTEYLKTLMALGYSKEEIRDAIENGLTAAESNQSSSNEEVENEEMEEYIDWAYKTITQTLKMYLKKQDMRTALIAMYVIHSNPNSDVEKFIEGLSNAAGICSSSIKQNVLGTNIYRSIGLLTNQLLPEEKKNLRKEFCLTSMRLVQRYLLLVETEKQLYALMEKSR